jgi:hypothetical protein
MNWVFTQLERLPLHWIGGTIQIGLGIAALSSPSLPGTSYAFINSHFPGASQFAGIMFLVSGCIMAFDSHRILHLLSCLFIGIYVLISFWGALSGAVSFQAGILYLGVFAYSLRSFPLTEQPRGT